MVISSSNFAVETLGPCKIIDQHLFRFVKHFFKLRRATPNAAIYSILGYFPPRYSQILILLKFIKRVLRRSPDEITYKAIEQAIENGKTRKTSWLRMVDAHLPNERKICWISSHDEILKRLQDMNVHEIVDTIRRNFICDTAAEITNRPERGGKLFLCHRSPTITKDSRSSTDCRHTSHQLS